MKQIQKNYSLIILALVVSVLLISQYQNCGPNMPAWTANTSTASTTGTPTTASAAIACGSGVSYTSFSSGISWSSDMYYSGGTADPYYSTPVANAPSGDGQVYQSNRDSNFSYNIPMANGVHQVTLKFAEYYWNSSGQRLFNITINGLMVLSSFDIYAAAGGKYLAIDETFSVTVTNGYVNIVAQTVKDNAQINGILIY